MSKKIIGGAKAEHLSDGDGRQVPQRIREPAEVQGFDAPQEPADLVADSV
jgi:hypothetical protein